jgi:hypothetical protein
MNENNIALLVPTKSDKERAEEIKKELAEIHIPVCALLDKIHQDGFEANVQVGLNAFGKYAVMGLMVIKRF